ncbi:hypothetical protein K439DRAFT_1554951 [Ramaria rubella]|nr:hypothetical protein K439DRAFT_1554951 [Ramaria rubella]
MQEGLRGQPTRKGVVERERQNARTQLIISATLWQSRDIGQLASGKLLSHCPRLWPGQTVRAPLTFFVNVICCLAPDSTDCSGSGTGNGCNFASLIHMVGCLNNTLVIPTIRDYQISGGSNWKKPVVVFTGGNLSATVSVTVYSILKFPIVPKFVRHDPKVGPPSSWVHDQPTWMALRKPFRYWHYQHAPVTPLVGERRLLQHQSPHHLLRFLMLAKEGRGMAILC